MSELKYTIGLDTNQLKYDSAKAKAMLTSIGSTAVKEGHDVDATFKNIGRSVATYLTGRELLQFAKSIADVRGEFQQLEISFTTMLGSKAKADKLMSEVVEFTATTPYELADVGKGAKQLLAFQVPADQITSKLREIGDLAAGANVPITDLVSSYGKVKAKGKLQAEEMNLFLERGIPLVSELAKQYNTTEAAIYKMAEQGKIGIKDLDQVIQNLTGNGGMFHNLMEEQSKSIPGMMSNLSDMIAQMMNDIGTANQEAIESIIKNGQFAVDHYEEIGTVLKTLVVTYGSYKAAVISTAAIKQASETVQLQKEGVELSKLISKDKLRALGIKEITNLTKEQSIAIKEKMAIEVQEAAVIAKKASSEVASAKLSITNTRLALQQKKAYVKSLQGELIYELQNGNEKKANTLQTKINTAVTEQNTLSKKLRAEKIAVVGLQEKAQTANTAANTIVTKVSSATEKGSATAKNILSVATKRLVVSLKTMGAAVASNPLGVLVFAVTALIPLFIKMSAKQKEATKQQNRLNDSIRDAETHITAETSKLDAHFSRLDAAKEGTKEYADARQVIMDNYSQYLTNLGDENTALNDTARAYVAIKEGIVEAAQAKASEQAINEATEDYSTKHTETKDDLQSLFERKYKGQTDDDGKSLAKVNYAKIRPVLEGKEEITDEIQDIVDSFDITVQKGAYQGMGGYSVTTNKVKELFAKEEKDRTLFEDLLEESINYKKKAEIKEPLDENINALEERRKALQTSIDSPLTYSGDLDKLNADLTQVNSDLEMMYEQKAKLNKQGLNSEDDDTKTVDQLIAKSLDKISDYKEKVANLRSGKTESDTVVQDIDDFVKKIGEEEKRLKSLIGDSGKDYTNEIVKNKQAELRLRKEQDFTIRQYDIDQKKDGLKKNLAQNKLNFDKELEQIRQQREDRLTELQSNEKTQYLADGGDEKTFVATSTLPQADTDFFNEAAKAATTAWNNSNAVVMTNANAASKAIEDKYAGTAAKRLAIEESFNKDIEALTKRRNVFITSGDTESADKTSLAIGAALKGKGEALMSFDLDVFKSNPEYIKAFEDLSNTSSDTLNSLLSNLEAFKNNAAATLNPEDLREYASTVQGLIDELNSRDPFGALRTASDEMAASKERLSTATSRLSKVLSGEQVVSSQSYNSAGKLIKTYLTEEDALKDVADANDDYTKSSSTVVKAQKKVTAIFSEFGASLEELGSAIGGTAGDTIALMGQIFSFVSVSVDGIKAVAVAAGEGISAVEKASIILGIIATAIQLLTKISELFETLMNKKANEFKEKMAAINLLEDAVSSYESAVLKAKLAEDDWFGDDELSSLADQKLLQLDAKTAYFEKLNQDQATYENEDAGGFFNTTAGEVLAGNYVRLAQDIKDSQKEGTTTSARDNLNIETRASTKGFLGVGAKSQKTENLEDYLHENLGDDFDLFDEEGWLNEEAYATVMESYGDKLVGQTAETLDELAALKEQHDEYLESLQSYVSDMYSPLIDNFSDGIWDSIVDDGVNAFDAIQDYAAETFQSIIKDLIKTMVMDKIFKGFSDDLTGYYDSYNTGDLTEAELMEKVGERTSQLNKDAAAQIPVIQSMAETAISGLEADTGYDIDGSDETDSVSQQSAASKGYETMSQETGTELAGIDRGIQTNTAIANTHLSSIKDAFIETKAYSLIGINHLANIEKNTLNTVKAIQENKIELEAIKTKL